MGNIVDMAKYGCSITRPGCYGLDPHTAELLLETSRQFKSNAFIWYDRIVYYAWGNHENEIISIEDYDSFRKDTFTLHELGAITDDEKSGYLLHLEQLKNYTELYHGRGQNRKQASRYIQKKDVRKRIMEKCYYSCVECGSEENLSIDHIRPVAMGGTNEDGNLQVLCTSCNSSKGSKLDWEGKE